LGGFLLFVFVLGCVLFRGCFVVGNILFLGGFCLMWVGPL